LCEFVALNYNIVESIELHVTVNNGDNTASLFALLCCVSISSAFMFVLCSGPKQRVLRSWCKVHYLFIRFYPNLAVIDSFP